jgi:hypothetical protein
MPTTSLVQMIASNLWNILDDFRGNSVYEKVIETSFKIIVENTSV